MATATAGQYRHLEPRPGSNYRQLFLKGNKLSFVLVETGAQKMPQPPCRVGNFARRDRR